MGSRVFLALGAFLALGSNVQAANLPVKALFRVAPGQESPAIRQLLEGKAKPVSFGMTQAQIERIRALTQGRVDFRNFVSVEIDSNGGARSFSRIREFQGYDNPNVPPPSFIETADPKLANEWWIARLKVTEAWRYATGKGINIADCDAGFFTKESDLKRNLLLKHRYDLSGIDTPFDVGDGKFVFHGTAVTAIIAGVLDGKGTNGIAFDSKIVPLQNFNYDPNIDRLDKEEATARCVLRAITTPRVHVIVIENQTDHGSSETYAGTREAVKLALAAGITVVSAGGNNNLELVAEEKDDTGSIIVGAVESNGDKAGFSNFGSRVSIAAFGRDLKTLLGPNGRMGAFGGTSGATPQVAATVALMLEANPKLTPEKVKKILIDTRTTTSSNALVGGQLNTLAAVEGALRTKISASAMQSRRRLKGQIELLLGSQLRK